MKALEYALDMFYSTYADKDVQVKTIKRTNLFDKILLDDRL